jgi:hypothetical protein
MSRFDRSGIVALAQVLVFSVSISTFVLNPIFATISLDKQQDVAERIFCAYYPRYHLTGK